MDGILQLLLFGGLMVLMMRFGCGSHLFGNGQKDEGKPHAGGCGGSQKKVSTLPDPGTHSAPPKSDIDPVCGETVSTNKAKTSLHDGLVYFFCSDECRASFEVSPEKYAINENEVISLHPHRPEVKGSGHA